jgi:hypothetical protein
MADRMERALVIVSLKLVCKQDYPKWYILAYKIHLRDNLLITHGFVAIRITMACNP